MNSLDWVHGVRVLQICSEISRRLGKAVYSICKGDGDMDLFKVFIEDFIDCSHFLDYFRAICGDIFLLVLVFFFFNFCPGTWNTTLKTLPLASQETCAAMEYYHHQLKLRLLNEKDQSVYQRTDWLVNKLGTKIHSYFWLDEYSGKDDFSRYSKYEWMSEKAHIVWNPGTEFAICDCEWSKMGNLCKHVIKLTRVCHNKGPALPSIKPHDSLIRDHAVTLAIYAQMQLNPLVDQGCFATRNKVVDESQFASKSTPCNRNFSVVGNETCAAVAGDLGIKVVDKVASEAGFPTEIDKQMNVCSEMDIDSLHTCTSPSMIFPVGGVAFDIGFLENRSRDLIDEGRGLSLDLSSFGESDNVINSLVSDNVLCDGVQREPTIESRERLVWGYQFTAEVYAGSFVFQMAKEKGERAKKEQRSGVIGLWKHGQEWYVLLSFETHQNAFKVRK
ncbi:hypothetical protein NE237_017301 [Protea cynaroides]|uniref:SWIM-type domain-containing protein n=1 Tax=Protea cynaroides TaxID=273540 RepID=A0A9Q0K7R8_9MAGN|nr:hypothetical protein NE237_017301 [Protea cynaroides]